MDLDFPQIYLDKLKFIDENKEKLIAAWIAETGCRPTESLLCMREKNGVTKVWVERKDVIGLLLYK